MQRNDLSSSLDMGAGFSRVIIVDHTGSTNADAVAELSSSSADAWGELSVLATADQRQGRGRLDRQWQAPRNSALCTSFVVRPHAGSGQVLPLESLRWITMLVAVAAVDTLRGFSLDASIKWPNDVLVGHKKICGGLAQLVVEPGGGASVVVGIGMNVNMSESELPVETATSTYVLLGKELDLDAVLRSLAEHFERHYRAFASVYGDAERPDSSGVCLLDKVRSRLSTVGQDVKVHLPDNTVLEGRAIDIDGEGELQVRDARGKMWSFAAGDIVHMRPESYGA